MSILNRTMFLNRTMIATAVLALVSTSTPSRAAETVSVRLENGKRLTARVDPRTDEERLWLRFGNGSAVIRRGIHWQHIAEAVHQGETIGQGELQALADKANDEPAEATPEPQRPAGKSDAERARELLGFGRRVSAIDFDAHLANWDADVEMDGIALQLFPKDSQGRLANVRGTLEVELVANHTENFNHAPSSRGRQPRQLARWTVALHADDITADGLTIKLPFQNAHPEFDNKWATHGLMHVRLIVPGQGVFEHSFDGLRIRPYAPLRDSMERDSGRRFLPSEQTSIGKRIRD